MTIAEQIIIIAVAVLGTMLTRFLPFLIFRNAEKTPKYVKYLGKVLPCAITGFLAVYSLKSTNVTAYPFGVPELISIAVVVALHYWKRNMLLSIAGGTACYMLLVQLVFA